MSGTTKDCTAEDWDARVTRLSEKRPARAGKAAAWLREPARLPLRVLAGVLLCIGGVFSILPILGLWMLPLGLALLAQDIPALEVPLERAARRVGRTWARLRNR